MEGELCDPSVDLDSTLPGALHRFGAGAGGATPSRLRGIFAYIVFDDGNVRVIDIEDYDSLCRRPVQTNASDEPDFRGCLGDPSAVPFVVSEDPTVTDEISCNMVQRHRARSATLMLNSAELGWASAGVRAFPALTGADGRILPNDRSDEGRQNPKMLAVLHRDDQVPTLFVAGTEHGPDSTDEEERLPLNPALASHNSLALITNEPRAYFGGSGANYSAVYEGKIRGERPAGVLGSSQSAIELSADLNAAFCSGGVEDQDAMTDRGTQMGLSGEALDAFARDHADFVHITSSFPDEDSAWWTGARCGSFSAIGEVAGVDLSGPPHLMCRAVFGSPTDPLPPRDLRILEAYQSRLVIERRGGLGSAFDLPAPGQAAGGTSAYGELLSCCFPEALSYEVRAGDQWVVSSPYFYHSIHASPRELQSGATEYRCVRDPNPWRSRLDGRAFEVSCADSDDGQSCAAAGVGVDPTATACVSALTESYRCGPEEPAQLACEPPAAFAGSPACVFQSLTTRFAVYRGDTPSQRDMRFSWTMTGAFDPMTVPLGVPPSYSQNVPAAIAYAQKAGLLLVGDAQRQGVVPIAVGSPSGQIPVPIQ